MKGKSCDRQETPFGLVYAQVALDDGYHFAALVPL